MEDSKKTLEPTAYTWTNLSRDGGQAVKEIGFTAPLYIPTDKLSPLYDRTAVEALERDAARFQWVERNWHADLHIDYYGPESKRPGYFHTWLVDGIEVGYGEERYATYGEAVDAAIAREKNGLSDARKSFEWWAINNQPWLLEQPKDDAHKLLILTAWETWQAAISAQSQAAINLGSAN